MISVNSSIRNFEKKLVRKNLTKPNLIARVSENSYAGEVCKNVAISGDITQHLKANISFRKFQDFVSREKDLLVQSFGGLTDNIDSCTENFLKVANTREYAKMSRSERKICAAVSVLFGIAKDKKIDVAVFPEKYSQAIKKYVGNFREEDRIKGLVAHSALLDQLAKRENSSAPLDLNKSADYMLLKDIGFHFRKAGDFKIVKLLAQKGLYGIYHPEVQVNATQNVDKYLQKLHTNGIWVPITRIPAASQIKKAVVSLGKAEEITRNKIIVLKTDNLSELGFEKNASIENFSSLAHAVTPEKFHTDLFLMKTQEGCDDLLSTSYFTKDHFQTFVNKKFGFLLDADPGNIALADNQNMGSGFGKDLIDFKNILFSPFPKEERRQFAETFREISGLTKEQYVEKYEKLSSARNLDDIRDLSMREAAAVTIDKTIINKEGKINELVVYAPKPTAVFAKVDNAEEVPFNLRKFAQDNDLLIVLLGLE